METKNNKINKFWKGVTFEDVMVFERPDNYIVKSSVYSDAMPTPVLTANKSFILGYTDEDFGVYNNLPAIIFDDFTTDSKYVDFPFKIKSSAIKILKSKNADVADLKFLFEVMKLTKFPTGNHKRYYISQYQKQTINLPPLKEQQKIAEILSVVDEDIEKTKATIKATEKLKRGLMQELFTRGIGHAKFKQTNIGIIPDSWELVPLSRIRDFVTSGSRGWAKYYADEGSLFIRVTNLSKKTTAIDLSDVKYVSVKNVGEGLRTKVKIGDIVISITADLGRIGLIDERFSDAYVSQHVALVRFKAGHVLPEYVAEYFQSVTAQIQFLGSNEGATKQGLSLISVEKIIIPVPDIVEQEKIAEILSSVDEKISINKKLLAKQTELKKGLMQDLLSGNKRVQS